MIGQRFAGPRRKQYREEAVAVYVKNGRGVRLSVLEFSNEGSPIRQRRKNRLCARNNFHHLGLPGAVPPPGLLCWAGGCGDRARLEFFSEVEDRPRMVTRVSWCRSRSRMSAVTTRSPAKRVAQVSHRLPSPTVF
jgi:hypothetical protein